MKRLLNFIKKQTAFVYQNNVLRVTFYLMIVAAILLVYLYAKNVPIAFVYNDF